MAAFDVKAVEGGLTPGMIRASEHAQELLSGTPGLSCSRFPEQLPSGMSSRRYLRRLCVGCETGEVPIRAPHEELVRQIRRHAPWLSSTSHGYLSVSDLHRWAEVTFDPGLSWVRPVLEAFQDFVLVPNSGSVGIAMALDENAYAIYALSIEKGRFDDGSGVVRVAPRPGPRPSRGWAAPERATPRMTVSLWRRALTRLGASAEHLALFDRMAALQPPSDPSRHKRLRTRWTRLSQLWLAASYPDFGAWLRRSGLAPTLSFDGVDLRGIRLPGADLSRTDFSGASLAGASLAGANLFDCFLMSTDLTAADLSRAQLPRANLTAADLWRAELQGANLAAAILRQADLSEANFTKAALSGAILDHADLSRANLEGANLLDAHLGSAKLIEANLTGATLRRADLRRADLEGASLAGADLSGAELSGAFYPVGDVPPGYSRAPDECLRRLPAA
jgi:uncharacterized protein YjbI with pentapeptide repeats